MAAFVHSLCYLVQVSRKFRGRNQNWFSADRVKKGISKIKFLLYCKCWQNPNFRHVIWERGLEKDNIPRSKQWKYSSDLIFNLQFEQHTPDGTQWWENCTCAALRDGICKHKELVKASESPSGLTVICTLRKHTKLFTL